MRRRRLLAIVSAMALGFAACAPTEDAAPTTMAAPQSSSTAATTAEPPASTSRLTAEPSAISLEIGAIYPGIPGDKAADWARYTCREIEKGYDPDAFVATRFGNPPQRPDPTPEQVVAIVAVIQPTC